MTALNIATWNVNSVKSRLAHLLDWLKRDKPDIVLLQELKCVEEAFPAMEIEDLGYNLAVYGEKTYNGVAILSKYRLGDVQKGLPGNEDDPHARYIEAVTETPSGIVRIASVYVPNGQTPDSEKFQYKLRFLDRFSERCKTLLSYGETLVIGGDYNIAPEDADVHNPREWKDTVLTHDEVRRHFRKLLHLGLYDAWRLCYPSEPGYSWWDYRAGALARDDGLRIDHLLLSPQAADKIFGCVVRKDLRELDKASDHAPVSAEFNL